MITRLVQMTFREDSIEVFLEIFKKSKQAIRSFSGCTKLVLYQDAVDNRIFFTYSTWDSVSHLEAYRNSLLFKKTWKLTKVLFADKAKAWTLYLPSS